MNIYDFSYQKPNGQEVSMETYKGKVILIVNTATKCGLAPQFDGLEKLHQTYKDEGLVVIGMPCNQFMSQEPETDETMVEACKLNFGVTFPLTKKIDVNGRDTHPIFKYLKKELSGFLTDSIKWNFTKFLIDRTGTPVKRFSPRDKPESFEKKIKDLLAH